MHTGKTYVRSLLLLGALLLVLNARGQFAAAQQPALGSVPAEQPAPAQQPTATPPPTPEVTATAAVATADRGVTHAENDRVPEGAAWTQHYFPSSDGSDVELHADVLLPEGLAAGEQVPVILVVGPYLGHSGGQALENHAHTGPSNRFNDLIEGADLFQRGYAFVMVDTRGFGGSSGCVDFAGRGDQADVKAAIDWAATQPWSTGAVGMYGKSADAITSLIGSNLNHDALKAVIAQEPIWDLYRNFRSNGVPRATIVSVANIYNTIATLPQMPDDDERYRTNAKYEKTDPMCYLDNLVKYQIPDPESDHWTTRDLAEQAKGTDTPLFFTQGFLEWNTEAEAVEEFLANHQGPQRGWLGPWEHYRGNERTEDGRLKMGREGWFDEVISFYDQYLKGIEPTVSYPAYAVQDSTGAWRAQDAWPVMDAAVTIPLGGGSYLDDGLFADPAAKDINRFFIWSAPLEQPVRITGAPRVSLEIEGYGNVMVDLYDVAPDGNAVMFDRQVAVVKPGTTSFELRSTDWTLPVGHALAVEIGTIQPGVALDNDWIDTPSYETIIVHDARLELALDDPANDTPTPGEPAPWLETYRLLLHAEKLSPGTPSFTLPTSGR
ncbi:MULTISPECIES: CocE/NonD family hydrolase [Cyanophyceae]|uniref:CocE/NonD family hydrolase n=1 Tax=Cyanophyceae TaxID=3028117 RepID=UPI001686D774|nr:MULTISPECIES: CocE/NonD family hydrolase [Cyanophyceae]MBD1919490.1 CocE/NonD family hydrolase [Phormidium sp. FACHB-77]MBD2054416.1 CocE/NonD family hydrolase [Leptolyngbya sp. FACHB-60]